MLRKFFSTAASGLFVALLLFGAVELVVRWWGGAVPAPGMILDRHAEYFLSSPDGEDAWATNYWEDIREDLAFRIRRRRTQVMVFGGSNAWAFREPMLRDALHDAAPDGKFQVLNLGRNGYGSERVRLIFEQALDRFAPDVAVFYFGDNEFVESPWPHAVQQLPEALLDVHTARLVAQLVDRSRAGARTSPEPWVPDWNYYTEVSFDETLERLEALRANLRAMVEGARSRGVKVVICTVVYNRFSAPYGNRPSDGLSGSERRRFEALRAEAEALLPDFLDTLLPVHQDDRVRRMDWELGTGDEPEARADGLRVGMRPISGPLADVDLRLSLPKLWHSRLWRLNATFERLHARDVSEAELVALRAAAELLDQALAVVPDHPRTLFERALVGYLLREDPRRVERLFLDAASFDRAPKKSSEAINDILRAVAAEYPDTLLVDVDEHFAACSPDRLVGWELMYDHCHLLPGPSRYVMRLVGREIVARWFSSE